MVTSGGVDGVSDTSSDQIPVGPRGETAAAPVEELLRASRVVVEAVRTALASPDCQLPWEYENCGRVASLAALSHECVCLEHLDRSVQQMDPSPMVSLVVRHHLETWLTGVYLLLGGEEAFEKFVGATRRSDDAQRKAIAQLQADGGLGAYELAPVENADWEPAHWNYEDVAREVDRLAGESELLRGGRAAYQIGYRSFSGRLGAHPTWRLLDTYIDSTTGTAIVGPHDRTPTFRRAGLQWSILLTAIHATLALRERDLDISVFVRVFENLRVPQSETAQPSD